MEPRALNTRAFFNRTDEKQTLTERQQTASRLENALTSPFAVNDIALRLNSLFGSNAIDGSYIRSLIHFRPQDLTVTDNSSGGKEITLDVLAVAFGDNGNAVDHLSKTVKFTIRKDAYPTFLKNGFVVDFLFPIKKPGAYQLRVAIRDHASKKVGSANQFVEIPDLKKKRLTLSSAALEDLTLDAWQRRNSGGVFDPAEGHSKALNDTAVRQFKRGTVLNYALSAFNAKSIAGKPDLTSQARLYLNGKMIFDGKPIPVVPGRRSDASVVYFNSSLSLGTEMPLGDYVMQITVTDNNSRDKQRTAIQFIQFEIVE